MTIVAYQSAEDLQYVFASVRAFLSENAPVGANKNELDALTKSSDDMEAFLSFDRSSNGYRALASVSVSMVMLKITENDGNIIQPYKVLCHVSWPSYGTNTDGKSSLAATKIRLDLAQDILSFAEQLEEKFSDTIYVVVSTVKEQKEQAEKKAKERAVYAWLDNGHAARLAANKSRVVVEDVSSTKMPEGQFDLVLSGRSYMITRNDSQGKAYISIFRKSLEAPLARLRNKLRLMLSEREHTMTTGHFIASHYSPFAVPAHLKSKHNLTISNHVRRMTIEDHVCVRNVSLELRWAYVNSEFTRIAYVVESVKVLDPDSWLNDMSQAELCERFGASGMFAQDIATIIGNRDAEGFDGELKESTMENLQAEQNLRKRVPNGLLDDDGHAVKNVTRVSSVVFDDCELIIVWAYQDNGHVAYEVQQAVYLYGEGDSYENVDLSKYSQSGHYGDKIVEMLT